jgi:hypothetical protein
MFAKISFCTKLVFFLALNAADLLLTWRLLQGSGGRVYESNPVANWWLSAYGWPGLIAFKCGIVLLATTLALVISHYRPQTGDRLLTFSCSALAVIVLYSCGLFAFARNEPGQSTAAELNALTEEGRLLEMAVSKSRGFRNYKNNLINDLLAGRRTLEEVVNELARCEQYRQPRLMQILHRQYPGYSDAECLAVNLIEHSVNSIHSPAEARRAAARLEGQFRAAYDVPARCRYLHL